MRKKKEQKIFIVPDIHCRNFWLPLLEDTDSKIIFLGDEMDPYPFEFKGTGIDAEVQGIENLKKLIQFKKDNPERVTLIIGNHAMPYMFPECRFDASRKSIFHFEEISKLYTDNRDLYQYATHIDGYLITHAGMTKSYFNEMVKPDLTDISLDSICSILNNMRSHDMWMCGKYRWGYDPFSSPTWTDLREFNDSEYVGFPQVFGHTQLKESASVYKCLNEDGSVKGICCDSRCCFEFKDGDLTPIYRDYGQSEK